MHAVRTGRRRLKGHLDEESVRRERLPESPGLMSA